MVCKVDDRTGPLVDVKKWMDGQEAEVELKLRADKLQVRVRVCSSREECVCVWFAYDVGDHMSCVLCVCVSVHVVL